MIILALSLVAPTTVAVLEFRDKVPPDQRIEAAYLSDQVRAAVKQDLPRTKVITRENMLVLLKASGKTLEECEGECEVDTGRLIGADLVVSGELLKFGTQYELNMKLHDTRSGDLLAGVVASSPTADDLDRDLKPAVDKLLGPLLRSQLAERRKEDRPATVVGLWVTAGYDSAAYSGLTVGLSPLPSGFGWHLGGHLFFHAVGPLYLGGLLDYSLSNVTGPIIAAGVRFPLGDISLSGAFGYSDQNNPGAGSGLAALSAIDFGVASGFCFRVQGSWRRSSFSAASTTVLSGSGGLALNF